MKKLILISILLIGLLGCKGQSSIFYLNYPYRALPQVVLFSVDSGDVFCQADLVAEVTVDYLNQVIERGFVYDVNPLPDTLDNKFPDGSGLGTFSDSINDLSENTTYYFRAYALTNDTILYSNQEYFTTTILAPTADLGSVYNIDATAFNVETDVTTNDNTIIRIRVYATTGSLPLTSYPTGADDFEGVPAVDGSDNARLTGLTIGTEYNLGIYIETLCGISREDITTGSTLACTGTTYAVAYGTITSEFCPPLALTTSNGAEFDAYIFNASCGVRTFNGDAFKISSIAVGQYVWYSTCSGLVSSGTWLLYSANKVITTSSSGIITGVYSY